MRQLLINGIDNADADYVDAMYEDTRQLQISFNKLEINGVSNTVLKGGRITALKNGGYAGASFTRPEDMGKAMVNASRTAARLGAFDTTNRLLPAPVIDDTVLPVMKTDPRSVGFDDKVALAREYMSLILSVPDVFTSFGSYYESVTRKSYVNSEGTRIDQDIVLCFLAFRIMSKNGKSTESAGITLGYDSDYDRLLNRHADVEKKARTVADLLRAEPVRPGMYTIVADQDLSGVFTHEAFGHLSEADDTINNRSLQDMLIIGRKMGNPCLNIVDDGSFPGASGTYRYDDQGVQATQTDLVRNGILTGRLHSRLSAAQLDGELTGNYRATDYRFMPQVRMSNIFIEQGVTPFPELLAAAENGLYLCGGKGGQTMGDLFTFGAQYGYEIRNGSLGKMVKDINISGNVFDTLGNITLIGNDFRMNEGGGCGKTRAGLFDMQMLEKSGTGGPSIVIKNVVIGGE
ncbi:TldD/PmbA family protein [bacterium]|nr:TldD/PmbA family protein [candidate division CSSED10-310 bacterium]